MQPSMVPREFSTWIVPRGKPKDGVTRYSDDLTRWEGPGNNELRVRLAHAFQSGQKIRTVITKTDDTAAIEAGTDARQDQEILVRKGRRVRRAKTWSSSSGVKAC